MFLHLRKKLLHLLKRRFHFLRVIHLHRILHSLEHRLDGGLITGYLIMTTHHPIHPLHHLHAGRNVCADVRERLLGLLQCRSHCINIMHLQSSTNVTCSPEISPLEM